MILEGREVKPKHATDSQKKFVKAIWEVKKQVKELYEKQEKLLKSFVDSEGVLNEGLVLKGEEGEYRTIVVGKPKGKFMYFQDLELIADAKTTKADQKVLGINS